jgi:cytochrome P450
MSYLEQYDRIPPDRPKDRVALVNGWIRTDGRALFAELRERRPIFRTPAYTMLTLFKDVEEVLTRHTVFTVRLYAPKMDPSVGPFMLARDETALNWRDKSIMRAMLPWEDLPRVRAMVGRFADEALDRWTPSGRIEVVGQLGRLIPVRLCGEYFGFPGPDAATMFRWSKATQTDFFKNVGGDPALHAAGVRAGQEMAAYLVDRVTAERAAAAKGAPLTGPETVLQRLLRTQFAEGLGFDDSRLVANVSGLLVGSVETTSQAIAQSLEQLLLRPEAFAAAVEAARAGDDARFDPFVWEALRFNPINPLLFRYTEADATVAAGTPRQVVLKAGTMVFACTSSAMADGTELPNPDAFAPGRPAHHLMHFGFGAHECLGKYVGMVMIPEVVKRVLIRAGVHLLPGAEGVIDFQGGPFPERFQIGLGA